jgi:hypothetical protein
MRPLILPLVFAAGLLVTTAATAGPTCEARNGDAVHCGAANAMPLGWSLPADKRAAAADADDLSPLMWFGLAAVIGGLFALIALMPNFDGWDGEAGDGDGD